MALVNVQLEVDGPITQMDEADLIKRVGGYEDENENVMYVEYRLRSDPRCDRAVHRSAHVNLKKPAVFADAVAGEFPQ